MNDSSIAVPANPGGMRDLELDDRFWHDALTALARGCRVSALSSRHSEYSACVTGIEADAARDAVLVGVRTAAAGQNGRLLSLVTAAFLARAGVRTLLVDLSPDVRWLERVVVEDLKEGVVDHIQYGVPLERCVRETALPDLSILTGGAHFLTGSPLDDAPAFRGALDRLRQRHRAVLVILPAADAAADAAGVAALCDILLAVVEEGLDLRLEGSERAVARLTGDPQAGEELARLTHRFLGSLPAFLAGPTRADTSRSAEATPRRRTDRPAEGDETEDDLAFLATFEEDRKDESVADRGTVVAAVVPVTRRTHGTRPTRRWKAAAVAMLAILASVAAIRFAPGLSRGLLGDGGSLDESLAELGLDKEPISLAGKMDTTEGGTVVPLMPGQGSRAMGSRDSSEGARADSAAGSPSLPAGQPAPYSLHVGSYQSESAAQGVVDRLAEAGYTAFRAPVSLPGGRWQRVYLGSFADSTVARRALEEVLRRKLVPEGVVRSTPWTFDMGAYSSRQEAADRITALGGMGISAYAAGNDPVRVYAGAYASREEAELLARALDASTAPASLTRREL